MGTQGVEREFEGLGKRHKVAAVATFSDASQTGAGGCRRIGVP
jgi:hypothetical protein